MRVRLLHVFAFCALAAGCGLSDKVDELKKDFDRQLEETRKVAREAIKAVPGERYLQLVDDLNSGDPERKKRAQTFLRSLGQFEPEASYEVSVWFDSSPATTIHADIIRASSNARVEADRYIKSSNFNPGEIQNPLNPAMTQDQIRAETKKRLLSVLNHICGTPHVEDVSANQGAWSNNKIFARWDSDLNPQEGLAPPSPHERITQLTASTAVQRDKVAAELTEAILLQFAMPRPMGAGRRLSKPWSMFDENQYLFILLRKKEWETFKDNSQLKITAVVHKAGDPNSTMNGQRVYQFDLAEFSPDPHAPIEGPRPDDGQLVWAVHNMNDSSLLSAEMLERTKTIQKIVAEWDEEAKKK